MKRLLVVLIFAAAAHAAELPSNERSLLNEVERAEQRGLDWLLKQQKPNGSWDNHPAITALAATAFLRSDKTLNADQQNAVDRALKFITSNVKSNGAIYSGDQTDPYPNYSTAICSMALMAANPVKYHDIIHGAREFLLASQFDESRGVASTNASYGGIGYGRRERPDLSNMQWTLEAIHRTESLDISADAPTRKNWDLHWQKAIQFLQRCQNLPSHNDQPWAKNATDRDLGGFIYMPGTSFANEGQPADEKTPLRSYGSMSYAGLKSYIYADLKKTDPRVVAAVNWLKRNYTLDENPGMGSAGLYYYLHTFAKALTAYGDDTFTDASGKRHDWRYELMNKLVSLQTNAGFWVNDNNRWWENNPVLVTSYSLLALEIVQARRYP